MLTVAATVIVPVTVVPPTGDEMLTMRLPPPGRVVEPPVWAEAGVGNIPCAPRIMNRAITAAPCAQDAQLLVFISVPFPSERRRAASAAELPVVMP